MVTASVLVFLLCAAARHMHSSTWLIDGNNLMAQRGTTRDKGLIGKSLANCTQAVQLVWDGQVGQKDMQVQNINEKFEIVSLPAGTTADDYIVEQVHHLTSSESQDNKLHNSMGRQRTVQVVTADRTLRRRVLEYGPRVRNVVHPITFWRRYLPRLCNLKNEGKRKASA